MPNFPSKKRYACGRPTICELRLERELVKSVELPQPLVEEALGPHVPELARFVYAEGHELRGPFFAPLHVDYTDVLRSERPLALSVRFGRLVLLMPAPADTITVRSSDPADASATLAP